MFSKTTPEITSLTLVKPTVTCNYELEHGRICSTQLVELIAEGVTTSNRRVIVEKVLARESFFWLRKIR